MPKAYPVYDDFYKADVEVLRSWLDVHAPNVYPVGRNGMHRYNNQDHSMYTAMLSVDNIFGAHHDVWTVNVDAEYHEEQIGTDVDASTPSGTGRDAPGACSTLLAARDRATVTGSRARPAPV
jgi:hypothetical protein